MGLAATNGVLIPVFTGVAAETVAACRMAVQFCGTLKGLEVVSNSDTFNNLFREQNSSNSTDSKGKNWEINNPSKSASHQRNKHWRYFKDSHVNKNRDQYWWSKDTSGHAEWKVMKETKKGLEWFTDADKAGNFITDKHKSDLGKFIPWKDLKIGK